ncbi:MAG: hypothetical protein WDK95_15850, partial [Syntrophorhabdaceae bacterium]
VTAEWIGLPPDSAKATMLVYLPKFTKNWMRGADRYMTILNDMGNFKGSLKGKSLDDARTILFDTRFIDRVRP